MPEMIEGLTWIIELIHNGDPKAAQAVAESLLDNLVEADHE